LEFYYNHIKYKNNDSNAYIEQIPVDDGFLKLSKKLNKLYFSQVKLSSKNLEEISASTNLKEINFEYCEIDEVGLGSFENLENLESLIIRNLSCEEKVIPKNINKIKSLKELGLSYVYCENSNYDFNGLDNLDYIGITLTKACELKLSNLDKLSNVGISGPDNFIIDHGTLSPFYFDLPDTLTGLSLSNLSLNSDNCKSIESITNLKKLFIFQNHDPVGFKESKNLDFLNELKNLTSLILTSTNIKEIPQLKSLEKLEELDLSNNELHQFPNFENLKNLKEIDLSFNKIDDKIPESLNNLENLYSINFLDNKNISGKVLTNKSLKSCGYSSNYDLCIPKGFELTCTKSEKYKTCEDEVTTTTTTTKKTTTTTKKTTTTTKKTEKTTKKTKKTTTTTTTNSKPTNDGKCGKDIGSCPSGQCCSKYGWCGKSYRHCAVSEGCQSKYGFCSKDNISNEGKCGKSYGKCPSGQCCSKYGWCGKSDDYCVKSKGCQSEFGVCKSSTTEKTTTTTKKTEKTTTTTKKTEKTTKKTKTTTTTTTTTTTNSKPTNDGKCGKDIGSCPSGQCCSKYGWCGKSYRHCAVSEGCQSKYGFCSKDNISNEGKCGKGYGKCPSGQCCSKYGWCGKTDDYCAKSEGCQSKFGDCK